MVFIEYPHEDIALLLGFVSVMQTLLGFFYML
jgi:hypothetical protein